MKKKITALMTIATLTFCTQAFAFKETAYGGLELGQAKLNIDATSLSLFDVGGFPLGPAKVTSNSNNFGARLIFGYQFAKYAAAEAGLTKYGDAHINNVFGVSGANVKISAFSLDAVGKAILPIDRFNLFAKLGFAGIHTKISPNSTAKAIVTPIGPVEFDQSQTKAKPIYGIGAGANLNKDFTITLAWTKVLTGHDNVKDATFTSIGFLFNFNM